MDIVFHILAGLVVGFAVGLTGIGGGSLMTPLLIFGFKVPPIVAVGTDLLYAAITKMSGVWVHSRRKTIEWPVVRLLAGGAIPGSVLTLGYLEIAEFNSEQLNWIMTQCLGTALIITSVLIALRGKIQEWMLKKKRSKARHISPKWRSVSTVFVGLFVGVIVTLSSVGAGVLGTTMLLLLYPAMPAVTVVGTELALAVPLTLVAGLGHLKMGHIDYQLLLGLLIGSLPGVYVGSQLGAKISDKILRPVLAVILLVVGCNMVFVT